MFLYQNQLVSHFSRVLLFVTPWTVADQAPLSRGLLQARILEWIAMPSSGGLLDPGVKPPLKNLSLAGRFFTTGVTWEAQKCDC